MTAKDLDFKSGQGKISPAQKNTNPTPKPNPLRPMATFKGAQKPNPLKPVATFKADRADRGGSKSNSERPK